MKYIVVGVVGVVALGVAVVGGLFLAPDITKADPPPKVDPVRYWPTSKLEAELAPRFAQQKGPGYILLPANVTCNVFQTQAFRRTVLVCVASTRTAESAPQGQAG